MQEDGEQSLVTLDRLVHPNHHLVIQLKQDLLNQYAQLSRFMH